MQYLYGVWHYLYRRSGLNLPLATRRTLQRALRPLPSDQTVASYRARCITQIPHQLALPHLATPLADLDADDWQDRWDHATWHPQRLLPAFGVDDHQRPLYRIAAVCPRCGHEFLGREAIGAPSITTCACFWCCADQLRVLPRYPLTGQQAPLDLT